MTMQRTPLLMSRLLDRGAWIAPDEEVVTLTAGGTHRQTYAATRRRAGQLANGLIDLGIEFGDRVATFMWNGSRHLELYHAVPSIGAVLHTLNIRLGAGEPRVHRQSRRRPHHLRRCGSRADSRAARPGDSKRRALRRVRRAGHGAPRDLAPELGRLRGLHRRLRPGDRLARVRRERAFGPVLHERHHRQPEGRDVHPSLDLPAHHGRGDDGHPLPERRGLRVRGGADVSCDGLGPSLRGDHARRPAGHAAPVHGPRGRCSASSRPRGSPSPPACPPSGKGCGPSSRPSRSATTSPRSTGSCAAAPPADLAHSLVLGRAPGGDDPGLGHDRDESARNRLAADREALPPRARRGRPVRERRQGGSAQPGARDGDRRRGLPAGAPRRKALGELLVRGPWVCSEYYQDPSRTSSGTDGSSPETSRPSTRRSTSSSPTVPRTW